MFSETPEEMPGEDTAGWASQPRQRDLIHTHTHADKQHSGHSRDGDGEMVEGSVTSMLMTCFRVECVKNTLY